MSGELLAQWAAIVAAFCYFMYTRIRDSGKTTEKVSHISNELSEYKELQKELLEELLNKAEKLEKRVNATGGKGLISWNDHDKVQRECQTRLLEKIQLNADVFERVANRMDKMDDRRESKREKDDARLRAIEVSIATMSESVKHLAEVIDRRTFNKNQPETD